MKRLLILLLLLSMILPLFSCGKDEELPEGMQLAADKETLGFALYVPEEWTVSSYGNVAASYVSQLDTSSVSLVRVYPAAGESLDDYMHRSLAMAKEPVGMVEDGKDITFGNAKSARSYVYTTKIGEFAYRIWQVLAVAEDGATYLFTYTASDAEKSAGVTFYAENHERVKEILSLVKLGTATEYKFEEQIYATDAEGYELVSDEKLAGFSFYIPAAWSATMQSGMVIARAEDGATITVSEATSTGVAVNQYYEDRKSVLASIYSDFTEIAPLREIPFANAREACVASYCYKDKAGTTYKVYQVIAVAGPLLAQKGYVLTFTAPADVYDSHADELDKMMEKFSFK